MALTSVRVTAKLSKWYNNGSGSTIFSLFWEGIDVLIVLTLFSFFLWGGGEKIKAFHLSFRQRVCPCVHVLVIYATSPRPLVLQTGNLDSLLGHIWRYHGLSKLWSDPWGEVRMGFLKITQKFSAIKIIYYLFIYLFVINIIPAPDFFLVNAPKRRDTSIRECLFLTLSSRIFDMDSSVSDFGHIRCRK